MNPWRKPEIHRLYYFHQSAEIFVISPLQMKPRLKSLARGLGIRSFSTLFTSQPLEALAPTASAGKEAPSLRPTVMDLPRTALWLMGEQNAVQHSQKALFPSVPFFSPSHSPSIPSPSSPHTRRQIKKALNYQHDEVVEEIIYEGGTRGITRS